jgi:hypothetical protein
MPSFNKIIPWIFIDGDAKGWTGLGGRDRYDRRISDTIGRHFNSAQHNGLEDTSIHIVEFIHTPPDHKLAKATRLEKESNWIHRLRTVSPMGLNIKDNTHPGRHTVWYTFLVFLFMNLYWNWREFTSLETISQIGQLFTSKQILANSSGIHHKFVMIPLTLSGTVSA